MNTFSRIMCLYQVERPYARLPGGGDCLVCTSSPENKECSNYIPLGVMFYHLKLREGEEKNP